jgi:2-polyprenyl-3-methyl-5-hydroxy-6-metoxy-1,4-benzoquinol methylase
MDLLGGQMREMKLKGTGTRTLVSAMELAFKTKTVRGNSTPMLSQRRKGNFYRKNYISVKFLKGRHRKTIGLLEGLRPETILDVGCDDAHFLQMLDQRFPDARLMACDVDPEPVAEARKEVPRAEFVVANFLEQDFDETELAVMLEILEHSDDPNAMLKKAMSLITADGWILVSIPRPELLHWRILWWMWSHTLGRRWHGQHNQLSEKELTRIAADCGLVPQKRARYFLGSISITLFKHVDA